MRAQARRWNARRIGRADDGADRGAGNGDRPKLHLVERLEHRDMREAARPAPAERKRDACFFRMRLAQPYSRSCEA